MKRRTTAGFSLIEALVVVSIICVLAAIAIPMSLNAVKTYRLSAAVAATTGALQATRYQAIMHGYQYQLTLTSSTLSLSSLQHGPAGDDFLCGRFAVPIARSGDVTMSRYEFHLHVLANGTVRSSPARRGRTCKSAMGYRLTPSRFQEWEMFQSPARKQPAAHRGFTLMEVMVALTILVVGLMAASSADGECVQVHGALPVHGDGGPACLRKTRGS